jgi:type VI secretion system protein ImpH
VSTYGWGTDQSVADWLFTEGYRFDFYRAVALLERLVPHTIPVGEGSEPEREAVRFTSQVGLAFPASDIVEVRQPESEHTPADMTVHFLGLAGCLGPMPIPYTELLIERSWRRDTALRDFLDIFNHRLVSLMYRVRKLHRLGLDFTPPDQTPVARYLFALMGLGTPGLQGRMQVKDRALLSYTGLVAQHPRSMIGLELLLTDYFQVKVAGEQFHGRWYPLEEDQLTTIGLSGQNQRLGRGAVLGTRVWEQQGTFALRLGPLTLAQFLDFLPIGRGFQSLCALTRFYVGHELEFGFRLTLQAGEVPESRLSVTNGPRLGWTSWLKTREFSEDDTQVRLTSRRQS